MLIGYAGYGVGLKREVEGGPSEIKESLDRKRVDLLGFSYYK